MLRPSSLALLVLAATAANPSNANAYPAYCAKDMSANKIQPLEPSTARTLQLVQVQVVVRHGARTPWSGKKCWDGYDEEWNCSIRELQRPEIVGNKTWAASREFEKIYTRGDNTFRGTCNLGQMIDEGYSQQVSNGQHLREAYVGPQGLFKSTEGLDFTNTSDFYFESSDIPRTINSGMVQFTKAPDIVDFIIMDTLFTSTNASSSSIASPSKPPPVPWHTNDYARNTITPNPSMCPKLNWIDAHWRQSPEYVRWTRSAANTKLEQDIRRVVTNYDHVTLYDCFMTAKCTDRALPAGIDDDLFVRSTSREESVQIQQYLYNHSAYAQAGMAAYTKRLRDRAVAVTLGNGPRFVLSAAHDTTIMPLLAALGGSAWLTEWVPYASHMIFEVYANATSHYVRVLYQGQPLAIPGCATEVCPFEALLALTAFSIDESICDKPLTAGQQKQQQPIATLPGTYDLDWGMYMGAQLKLALLYIAPESVSSSGWTYAYVVGGVLAGTALGYFAGARSADRQGYTALGDKSLS
ncbi:hypothetical protein DYB26_010192 [Aphanomyces astaci]|uniref:Histidine acid phosphatase n=2 Tax=Aphanomyces astaci TaxID=112090 RepID=A0A397AF42_APHAT|nr:hypothetical protein DYB36_008657 [Aphanomyces astaci]RHZ34749.1 hypothetical protein DYB26_010192 [Aphanomyces astaci]